MNDQEIKNWYYQKRAEALIKNLAKKSMVGYYTADADEARDKVMSLIPEGATVILTGSQTLEQIGVKPILRDSGKYDTLNPYEPGIEPGEDIARRRRGMTADVMVSSTNAITEDGALVNLDGMGNRTAGMIFGPAKVVLAVGMNKVVADEEEAWVRIRNYSAPLNNRRINTPNPCTETGFCQDCNSKRRICNYFTVIERSYIPNRIHIVLIGQDLGY